MKKERTVLQNVIIALIYSGAFITLFAFAIHNLDSSSGQSLQVWLTAGILYVIIGKYILEKFFTSPLNVLTNCIGIIIAVAFDNNRSIFWYILLVTISFLLVWSMIVVCTSKKEYKAKGMLYKGLVSFGKAKIVFSIVFIFYSYQYLARNDLFAIFIISHLVWLDIVYWGFIEKVICFPHKRVKQSNYIYGVIDNKISSKLYTVTILNGKRQLDYKDICAINNGNGTYNIVKIVSINQDINNRQYIVYVADTVLTHNELKLSFLQNSLLNPNNSIFKIDINLLSDDVQTKITSALNKNECKNSIGYVAENSDINTINFVLYNYKHNEMFEGMIIEIYIDEQKTLFQIINANTKKDENGALRVSAQKLGSYDETKSTINHVKWLPELYSSVYIAKTSAKQAVASNTIGVLPNSKYQIKLSNTNQLVTYNTAILGILGIGKSCLAFELIQKIVAENIKVICIDISEQYGTYGGLLSYIEQSKIDLDCDDLTKKINANSNKKGTDEKKLNDWGNFTDFKALLKADIKMFLDSEDKMVRIVNPNLYNITKPQTLNFGKADGEFIEISLVEKVRHLVEAIFERVKEKGLSSNARYLIVFEEAHSLVPEFNSVAMKGDESHSNAVAKVILQGRKYGLGSLLITQRTANVSKSALCQCNTIFAMRSYDDTSKNFLDNFIGSNYSALLPALEERTAIITGKGIDCKMPIMITLNDKASFEKFSPPQQHSQNN